MGVVRLSGRRLSPLSDLNCKGQPVLHLICIRFLKNLTFQVWLFPGSRNLSDRELKMYRTGFLFNTVVLLSVIALIRDGEHKQGVALDLTYVRMWMTKRC